MKLELNYADFLTKEHKKAIVDKITEAINGLDVKRLTREIHQGLNEIDWGHIVYDEVDSSKFVEIIEDKIINALKK